MKIWPWSRFAKYKAEAEVLYGKFTEAEIAELELRDTVRDLELRLDTSVLARNELSTRAIDLGNKLRQMAVELNLSRFFYRQLDAELNSKARPSIVLKPPTEYVQRRKAEPASSAPSAPAHHGNGLESELDEFSDTSPWPFPTSTDYLGE